MKNMKEAGDVLFVYEIIYFLTLHFLEKNFLCQFVIAYFFANQTYTIS